MSVWNLCEHCGREYDPYEEHRCKASDVAAKIGEENDELRQRVAQLECVVAALLDRRVLPGANVPGGIMTPDQVAAAVNGDGFEFTIEQSGPWLTIRMEHR